jgi:hypothetical protein
VAVGPVVHDHRRFSVIRETICAIRVILSFVSNKDNYAVRRLGRLGTVELSRDADRVNPGLQYGDPGS